MADRLTQLQEAVNLLAEHFCNSIGVLQQATPTEPAAQAEDKGPATVQEENISQFTALIARTAHDIEILIDALPNHEHTQEKQLESLRRLELENQQCAAQLAKAVEEGEALLDTVRDTLKQISDSQLGICEVAKSQP